MRFCFAVIQAAVAASSRTTAVRSTLSARYSVAAMALGDGREVMQVKKLSKNAVMPVRGSEHAAGFDLASAYDAMVPAGRQAVIKTDLSIAIPPNTYARIAPRSGLAVKKMIDCGAGVVDYDYRGPVGVVLFNHGTEDFKVNKGDRVAQLILERICMADVEVVTELSETTRGTGGFGSTGVAPSAPATSPAENEAKKYKPTATGGGVPQLLNLINRAVGILELDPDSDVVMKLRERAVQCPALLEAPLNGVMEHYDDNGDKEELMRNLGCIRVA